MPVLSLGMPALHMAASIGSTDRIGTERASDTCRATVLLPEPGSPAITISFLGMGAL